MNNDDRKKEIDLMEYWGIIIKRKWVIVSFAGALIFFTAIFSFLATPKYKATSTLLIEEGTSKILSMEDAFGYQSPVVRDLRFYNTQLKLLESKSLAERVAKKLELLTRPEFTDKKKSVFAHIINIITFKWISSSKGSEDKTIEGRRTYNPYSDIAKMVRNRIKVKPIRDTKLVEVSYTSSSPILSAEVINTLAEEFINFSIEKRRELTQQASDFLNNQITALQEELAAKQRELDNYVKDKDLYSLSSLSDTESSTVSTLNDYYAAYTQARIDRIKAEAAYRELKDVVDVDSLPQSLSNPAIQQLKAEYTKIKNEYNEKSRDYKPDHPEMVRLRARLDNMKEELRNIVDTAEADYSAASKRESYLRSLLDRQKEDVARMSSSAIHYNSLKIEVENKRRQLDSLVEKRDETLVSQRLGGIKASNISIIDEAEVPKKPVSPNKKLNLFLAFFFGILGGGGLCFLLEYLDNSIKGPEDVERLVGLPSLGVIPYLDKKEIEKGKNYYQGDEYSYGDDSSESEVGPRIKEIELINHLYPQFSISEDYRTVRTSILLSHAESPPKSIVFTSAMPMEGKSTTVVNMAVSFSQLEEKILVIDSDLRRPRLHNIFKTRNIAGLSGYLTGKVELKDAIKKTSIKNIWVLPSGPIPPNPAELLNSKKMKGMIEEVKKDFDIILFDTPPILTVVDGIIVSSISDSTVMVINGSKLTRNPFVNAVEELKRARVKIIGVLFNGLRVKKGDYFHMDYYRYYRYDYYGEEEGRADSE